ncbi:Very-long-chain (3R)-3-hydroxyacyl-CoA dehydratase PASTICCINO 2A [Cucurbita argyrosperma subsp. argyrosperma]|nr:Very-long-chain (3R)-3-hydroxyacyl-CoA dehydratase PASTICCINO 2A [Cucurbita argyrosperma subsp. argyrosperma]
MLCTHFLIRFSRSSIVLHFSINGGIFGNYSAPVPLHLQLDSLRRMVFYFSVKQLKESGHQQVYNAVERPLQFAQTAAVLEILHGLVGFVRSPVTATLPQIGSRLYLTWGILWSFPEIIRYSFYGMKEAFGFAPSLLLWLRYSTFLLLYVTGITSEVGLVYLALPYMKVRNPMSCCTHDSLLRIQSQTDLGHAASKYTSFH